MTNPFRDQEKFMRACDQTVGAHNEDQYKLYINLIKEETEEHATEWTGGEIKFESVDAIVLNQIQAIDSAHIDKQILAHIYQGLTN